MNLCRILGHKWSYYQQEVPHETPAWNGQKTFTFIYEKDFRYCDKCSTNQSRVAHTTRDEIDWKNCELNVDQLRDKKLKELGI